MEQRDQLLKIHRLFNRMKTLAKRQMSILSDDRLEAYLPISSEREHLQKEINILEKEYHSVVSMGKDAYEEHIGKGNSNPTLRDIKEVITSIQEIDLQIEKIFYEKRNDLFTEIKGLRKGQKAVKGYGGKSISNPRYLNRHG